MIRRAMRIPGRRRHEADVSTLLLRNPPLRKAVLQRIVWGALAVSAAMALSLLLIARLLLASPGEWRTPLRMGPARFEVSVPTLIRLAASPWFGPRLAGRTVDTHWGPVRVGWDDAAHTLELRCAPCHVHVPALGAQPLHVAQLNLRVRRDFDRLTGTLDAEQPFLHATWDGTLNQQSLELQFEATAAPRDDTTTLRGRLRLPSADLALTPGSGLRLAGGWKRACNPRFGATARLRTAAVLGTRLAKHVQWTLLSLPHRRR